MKDLSEYPTPRTDAHLDTTCLWASARFARTLERENAALRDELKKVTKADSAWIDERADKGYMVRDAKEEPFIAALKNARAIFAAT